MSTTDINSFWLWLKCYQRVLFWSQHSCFQVCLNNNNKNFQPLKHSWSWFFSRHKISAFFRRSRKCRETKKNSSWWSPIKNFHWNIFCFHLNFGRRKCKELLLGRNNSRIWALPTKWARFMLLGFVSYGISMFIGLLGYQKKASGTLSWPTRLTCWDSPVSASYYQFGWILSNSSLSDSYFQSFVGQNINQRSNTGSLDL